MPDTPNFAEMSDADFLNLPVDAGFAAPEGEAELETHADDTAVVEEQIAQDAVTDDADADEDDTLADDTGSPEGDADEGKADALPEDTDALAAVLGTVGGVEIKSVEEARKLMQMGLDSHNSKKDMTEYRRTQKLLDMHKITQADLNMLIDIKLGKAKAVGALAKASGIDLDAYAVQDDESEYLPSDYSYSDDELRFEDTITRMRATDTFDRTMQVVRTDWDDKSRQEMVGNPQLLENLNTHMGNGVFDKVMASVKHARIFGGLEGMSDLEAYNKVGQVMAQRGEFGEVVSSAKQVSTVPKKTEDTNLADKRRKASPSKGSQRPAPQVTSGDQFIGMSDADFIKNHMKG